MGKHEEKSKKPKKSKKHKKKRRSSTSSSSSEEWVEKKSENAEKEVEREEWMNLSSSFHTTSNTSRRLIREENKRLEKEKEQYNPKENPRELNPFWKNDGDGLPSFKKPGDDNFEYKRSISSSTSNWRKKFETENKPTTSKYIGQIESESTSNKVTKKDLNSLAAKIVKAELMGKTELVEKLKQELEDARKVETSEEVDERDVILTSTDALGQSRPVKMKSEYGETSGSKSKKKKTETHKDGERIRYFPDDDKYSLKQMFEKEKYDTSDSQNKEFMKIATKMKTDLDDLFVDEIRKKDSDEKIDGRNKASAISKHQLLTKSLDNCKFCIQSEAMSKHLMVSMGETMYLSIPPFEPITDGHCFIIPLRHTPCVTQLDENEWSECLNFRKSLCKMFKSINKDVVFFETALYLHKYPHMIMECIPLDKEECDLAPMYFKKAIDESEVEWSVNKKLISLANRDVRRAVPKGLPYFSISFGMTEGYAHVIEDEKLFPQNFAQEIIGGMLDLHHSKWRKPKRQTFQEQSDRVQTFTKLWAEYDCTQ